MADLGTHQKFEKAEDEHAKWATGWDAADDAMYGAARRTFL